MAAETTSAREGSGSSTQGWTADARVAALRSATGDDGSGRTESVIGSSGLPPLALGRAVGVSTKTALRPPSVYSSRTFILCGRQRAGEAIRITQLSQWKPVPPVFHGDVENWSAESAGYPVR